VGLVTAVVAGYASVAAVTNSTFGRMVLPGDAVEAVTRAVSNAASWGRSSSSKHESRSRDHDPALG
jgi:hypothetical protein